MFRILQYAIVLSVILHCADGHSADPDSKHASKDFSVDNVFRIAWLQEQVGPEPAVQPELSLEPGDAASIGDSLRLPTPSQTGSLNIDLRDISFGETGSTQETLAALPAERLVQAGGAPAGASNIVLGSEASVRATTDAGDLLGSSLSNLGVYTRQENPIINQTRVRSFRYDQIRVTNSGASWFPIRPDFDTPLSRFDSSIVRDIIIIKGPYSVRNGPGFAFIDIALADSPRYSTAGEWGGFSKFLYNENGDQWYARQSLQGGGPTAGWRLGYGHTGGVDYETGRGTRLDSSNEARDIDFTYGVDINRFSSWEFNYLRSEMTNVQLPGQINDLIFLNSDGFNLKYSLREHELFDLLTINSWYNKSAFAGSGETRLSKSELENRPGAFDRAPRDRAFGNEIVTMGDNSSLGLRSAASWYGAQDNQLTAGFDVARNHQDYREGDSPIDRGNGKKFPPRIGVPLAQQDDIGLFSDATINATEDVKVRAGSRFDWIHSTAALTERGDKSPLLTGSGLFHPNALQYVGVDPGDFPKQNFALAASYLTVETLLTPVWTADLGAGYAERAPNPTELYADKVNLSITQQGGILQASGNNDLSEERMVQIDTGLTGKYEYLDLGVRGYHSWVDDFITLRPTNPFSQNPLKDFSAADFAIANPNTFGAPKFSNTQARLYGVESYGNYSITDQLSTFALMSYTRGWDETINLPLWGVAPLETTLGLRLQGLATSTSPSPWGLEYSVRMVSAQKQINNDGDLERDSFTTPELPVFPRGDGGDQEIATLPFTLHNLRGYYRFNRAVSMVGGIENIGDSLYREHLNSRRNLADFDKSVAQAPLLGGIFGRGRNLYIGIQSRY